MLQDRFCKYIEQQSLCGKQDRILLAVSGGVDSMAMMMLFAGCGYDIGVAHCNFQLRGDESEEDEVLVASEAARFGVPFYNKRFETERETEISGESVQMVARRLRYQWFDELCSQHGYNKIAIAHHADDSVETFFINMIRGTGLRGLTGINVVNGKLIRPLLFSTRKDILEFAKAGGLKYREDSSNSSTKYLRNKIRLGIIPLFKEILPRFAETMTANVERLTYAQTFIDRCIEDLRREAESREGDSHIIDVSVIDPTMPMKYVIFELMRKHGFNGDVTDKLCHSLEAGSATGKRFYARDKVAYIDRDRIIITPIPEDDTCDMAIGSDTKQVNFRGFTLLIDHIDIDDVDELKCPEQIALLDMDKVVFPLTVRRWQEGDSFVPFGMKGHKKVSDFLIDSKVAAPDKTRQAVIVSGEDIVWVVGRRVDDRYSVTSSTENVLRIVKDPDVVY